MKRTGDPVVFQSIAVQIIVGSVEGDALDDILNKMNADYLPKLLSEKNWPEGAKKEFVA